LLLNSDINVPSSKLGILVYENGIIGEIILNNFNWKIKIYDITDNKTDNEIDVELLSDIIEISVAIDTIDMINNMRKGIIYSIKLPIFIILMPALGIVVKKVDKLPV